MKSQSFGRWSAEELRVAADIAKEKGVGVRLQADGSIIVGETPPAVPKPIPSACINSAVASALPNAFSPASLAERWSCSERHVRNLIAQNLLEHFQLGGKLVRVSREEVERFESTPSHSSEMQVPTNDIDALPSGISTPTSLRGKRLIDPLARARINALRRGK